MFYYVYVLSSVKYKGIYTGQTNNLNKRVIEHNKGLIESTKRIKPLELIYFEGYKSRKLAMDREMYLKTGWGRNYIKKILNNL